MIGSYLFRQPQRQSIVAGDCDHRHEGAQSCRWGATSNGGRGVVVGRSVAADGCRRNYHVALQASSVTENFHRSCGAIHRHTLAGLKRGNKTGNPHNGG